MKNAGLEREVKREQQGIRPSEARPRGKQKKEEPEPLLLRTLERTKRGYFWATASLASSMATLVVAPARMTTSFVEVTFSPSRMDSAFRE